MVAECVVNCSLYIKKYLVTLMIEQVCLSLAFRVYVIPHSRNNILHSNKFLSLAGQCSILIWNTKPICYHTHNSLKFQSRFCWLNISCNLQTEHFCRFKPILWYNFWGKNHATKILVGFVFVDNMLVCFLGNILHFISDSSFWYRRS